MAKLRHAVPALLLAVSACSGSSTPIAPDLGSPAAQPVETYPVNPTGHPRTACDAFKSFYADLTTYTPHALALLNADALRVQRLAKTPHLERLADDLVATVGSPSWDQSGNVESPSVQAWSDLCSN